MSVNTRKPLVGTLPLYLVFLTIATTVLATDFEVCKKEFYYLNDSNRTSYLYTGRLYGGATIPPSQANNFISLPGCLKLCGSGIDYYHWKDVSKTITTWVLPVVGLLLQLPFESNQFWNTNYALVRWIGSPIASLSYILWNIKVIGKAALLSDMATAFNTIPQEDDPATHMRDSLFILSVMNQYTPKPSVDGKHATSLLRIALFASEIPTSEPMNLLRRRRKLGKVLREGRKRGIVPLFISLGWFVFALAISIQDAFGSVGDNATAHDLALGLLLAWFPVLIVSGIVDRNPVLTDNTRKKINKLLSDVHHALQQKEVLGRFCENSGVDSATLDWVFPGSSETHPSKSTDDDVNRLLSRDLESQNRAHLSSEFFTEIFAGQGRVRWHYGVAHPILAGIETSLVGKRHRNWLSNPNIENILVRGPESDTGLWEFDAREFWEIISSFIIVVGTISGAFVISYRTPTVGLGCRAGGYSVFGIIALGLFVIELLAWVAMSKMNIKNRTIPEKEQSRLPRVLNRILRLGELVNTAWLLYIVAAQTFGSYRNCNCQMSTWGHWGGYIDFTVIERASGVQPYWITSAVLSCFIMFTAITFLVVEWCEQSHLNTEDFGRAMEGLRVTRQWKQHTLFIRRIPDFIIWQAKRLWHFGRDSGKRQRQSLVWRVT